jgi:hypothetical protein
MKALKEVLSLIVVIVIAQISISVLFPPKLHEEIVSFNRIMEHPPHVLFFGDSSDRTVSPNDKDRRSIDAILGHYLSGISVVSIDHPAYDAGIYEAYAVSLATKKSVPKIVVIPINLRSFSPDWDMRPEYQFTTQQVYLRYGHTLLYPFLPFLLNMKAFPFLETSHESFVSSPVYDGTRRLGEVKDFDNDSFKIVTKSHDIQKVQLYYMYRLTRSHRKVQSLQQIQRLLAKRGVRCIFYITPIDFEYASRLLGDRSKSQIAANARIITSALMDVNAEVVDLTFSLNDKEFAHDADYIDEHLNEKGRSFVAEQLAKRILEKD